MFTDRDGNRVRAGYWEPKWIPTRYSSAGKRIVGIARGSCDELYFEEKIENRNYCSGLVAQNERGHWWCFIPETRKWSQIYMKPYNDLPNCYALTLKQDDSVGLFHGIIREETVVGVDLNGANRQVSEIKSSHEIGMRPYNHRGNEFGDSVKFVETFPISTFRIDLQYPNMSIVKNAKSCQ